MTKKHGFKSEAELAAMLVEHLRETGHTVFQEVDHPTGALDVAATKGEIISAFETKLSFSFAHMEQAARWRPHANYIWLVLPMYSPRKWPDGWLYGMRIAEKEGIGVIVLNGILPGRHKVTVKVKARLNPNAAGLKNYLNARQMTYSLAGCAGAKRWTPFKATVEEVVRFVGQHPGCNINDIVGSISHHYSSKSAARFTIPKRAKRGLFPGITMKLVNGLPTFFPATM